MIPDKCWNFSTGATGSPKARPATNNTLGYIFSQWNDSMCDCLGSLTTSVFSIPLSFSLSIPQIRFTCRWIIEFSLRPSFCCTDRWTFVACGLENRNGWKRWLTKFGCQNYETESHTDVVPCLICCVVRLWWRWGSLIFQDWTFSKGYCICFSHNFSLTNYLQLEIRKPVVGWESFQATQRFLMFVMFLSRVLFVLLQPLRSCVPSSRRWSIAQHCSRPSWSATWGGGTDCATSCRRTTTSSRPVCRRSRRNDVRHATHWRLITTGGADQHRLLFPPTLYCGVHCSWLAHGCRSLLWG